MRFVRWSLIITGSLLLARIELAGNYVLGRDVGTVQIEGMRPDWLTVRRCMI